MTKLSDEARKAIGSRPAFDLGVNFGSGRQVRHFGDGKITVTIPYTLGEKEKAGNIKAVYIDDNGKVHWLDCSVYDVEHQVRRFGTRHFSIFGVGYKEEVPAFQDIDNHWAKEDIEYVVRQGLFSGTSETAFSPDMAMTRGMFVAVIGRLAKADTSGYKESSFADVNSDAYCMGYIEWARSNHIISGVGKGKFAPRSTKLQYRNTAVRPHGNRGLDGRSPRYQHACQRHPIRVPVRRKTNSRERSSAVGVLS